MSAFKNNVFSEVRHVQLRNFVMKLILNLVLCLNNEHWTAVRKKEMLLFITLRSQIKIIVVIFIII